VRSSANAQTIQPRNAGLNCLGGAAGQKNAAINTENTLIQAQMIIAVTTTIGKL
jgi:hypothetical protein